MKFLHTSDWHLGITFNGKNSAEDQKFFTRQIIEIAKEQKVDAIIIAGDIFDRGVANSETIALYNDIMTDIVINNDIPVISIAGNHDSAERLSQCHELLEKAGLYIAGSLSREFQVVSFDDVDVYLLPWFSPDKVKAVFSERADEVTSMEEAYKVVLSEIKKTFNEKKKHVLVSHAYISNAKTSKSDKSAEIGTATAVSKEIFDDFDYVALGHIHMHQKLQENIYYCGTPMPYSFGKEETQKKGVIIVDTDDMSNDFVQLKLLHKRSTLNGTYSDLDNTDFDEATKNGYLRLEITDQYAGPEVFAHFLERFPLLLEMQGLGYKEGAGENTITMEDFQSKADSPEEILKSFCTDNKLDLNDDILNMFREVLEKIVEEENQ